MHSFGILSIMTLGLALVNADGIKTGVSAIFHFCTSKSC